MQQLFKRDMQENYAMEISKWKYPAPYDFYNLNSNSIKEFLENEYYCIFDNSDELIGFFCIGESAQVPAGVQFGAYLEDFVDIGIGMKPELTGSGKGTIFFSFILGEILMFAKTPIRLSVAKFNHRAIHLYEKCGFVKATEFFNKSTGFITMIRN